MAYVPVPKDLTKVKTKVMFNLTRRQLVCFTAGALVGVPLFLWLREPAGNSMAAMCMMLVMMPFFLLAMYEKHGQGLEKIVGNILKVAVIRPKQRPYQTNNFYAVLKRQEMLDKEVYDIVHRNEKLAAPSAGKTGRKDRASRPSCRRLRFPFRSSSRRSSTSSPSPSGRFRLPSKSPSSRSRARTWRSSPKPWPKSKPSSASRSCPRTRPSEA